MNMISTASRQWATRPADQRFTSLPGLLRKVNGRKKRAVERTVRSDGLICQANDAGELRLGQEMEWAPTHYAFGQLARIAKVPADYARSIEDADLVADMLNYGLQNGSKEFVKAYETPETLHALTGPAYGRIYDADIVTMLIEMFGDGVNGGGSSGGHFTVPGEFGQEVTVTQANTTIYGGESDIFVFLADEKNRIEVPNRRDGKPGSLARGFYVWNSEVGKMRCGVAAFTFDFVCSNRCIWGVDEFVEVSFRHSANAPTRWREELVPQLERYSQAKAGPLEKAIRATQASKIDDVAEFLIKPKYGFSKTRVGEIMDLHVKEEGRPIETVWDASVAITAFAREIPYQDQRVATERIAGEILELVAA